MNGLGKMLPFTAAFFALGSFAIVGLPPFAGFWSKLSVLTAAANQEMLLIIALVLLVSIVEIVYYFRVINRIYFFPFDKITSVVPHKPRINALVAMSVLAILILVIGFYPDSVSEMLSRASDDLLNTQEYIKNVLSASQTLTN